MRASPDLSDEPFGLVAADASEELIRLLRLALRVQGGTVADGPERGILADVETVARMSDEELEALRRRADRAPLFLFTTEEAVGGPAAAALAALGGPLLAEREVAQVHEFRFEDDEDLSTFRGLLFGESEPRRAAALVGKGPGLAPLVSSPAGCLFLRWTSAARRIYLSLVPLPLGTRLLKHEFRAARFMGLLPLLIFARAALGPRAWRVREALASLIVDDANLRLGRYGFLDYRRLLEGTRAQGVHVTLAMIPLDHRKTSGAVAALMRDNAERLSLVPHGVDHRRCEFATDVDLRQAENGLGQAVARMEAHRTRTGVEHANAMTFPHGACNATWLTAMRNIGLDAAIASCSFPFLAEEEIDDPLYELHPAQTTFLGFPVLNRFRADERKEELLFQAWLGKPLLLYTHHGFFRGGHGPLIELVEFLERQARPRWTGVADVLESNYQTRRTRNGWALRVFSNRIVVVEPRSEALEVVVKPGHGFPQDEEGRLDGERLELTEVANVGLVAPVGRRIGAPASVELRPGTGVRLPAPLRTAARSRIRRWATEFRDQARVRA